MKFSIIVPVYMSELYIENCISSILSQDFDDFELLIMDDGSTDKSISVCRRLIDGDERAAVYTLPHSGVSRARNLGISNARGDYILFVDSDDMLKTDCLSLLASEIGDFDIYMFGYNFILSNGRVKTVLPKSTGKIPSEQALCYYSSGYTNAVWNKLFRREFLVENSLMFDESVSMGEDLLFNYACVLKTDAVYPIPQVLYNYFQRPHSLSSQTFTAVNADAYGTLIKTRNLLVGNSRAVDEFELYIAETHITNLTKICSDSRTRKSADLRSLKKELKPRLMKYLRSPLPNSAIKLNAAAVYLSPTLWAAMRKIYNAFKKH
ncbi:MAG: glycosyltransferase family 2 protein [Firmicutes bacterium]|nr:glycosyltransferase family 2 protein [Bacillota bacterium]